MGGWQFIQTASYGSRHSRLKYQLELPLRNTKNIMSEYHTPEEALDHQDYIADRYIFDLETGLIIDTENNTILSHADSVA